MTATFHCAYGNGVYGDSGYGFLGSLARSAADRRASRADLPTGSGGGRLRVADLGQATGREAIHRGDHPRSCDAFGTDSSLREAGRQGSGQGQRGQAGASRPSPPRAAADRPLRRAHALGLSQVPRAGPTLPFRADAGRRGHPRRHHAGGHRTYDSSLLVPAVPRHGRAGRARRLAWLVHRPARRGAVGLAPLPAGYHAGADRRRVQFPPSVQALSRRPGVDVAAVAGGPFGLVPGNPDPGPPKRRAARRRDRLAGRRQDLLAVVLRDQRLDLLYDRPQSRISGLEEVLQERVRRGVGDRLLGRLQRGRLRAEAEMPAASAARHQAHPALPQAWWRLASIFQATEAADPRLAPLEQATEGVVRGGVRIATEPPGTTVARPAGAAVGGPACPPLGEAAAAARVRVVHVPGPS